ncbi:hypothetical protein EPUS_03992 [Endocarpon pusillum Z07020]|uniref:Uncharacterized protein n=1 Tax=Endocarpon pusillum (strain Z07020 / HMAS-L-300199) TaxID=1263415 RepID=U1GB86_ENDPU|nr:uncharacterized protein EPUS_03992 [Endocarpon pusillum Z07020]ERF69288.1 hypothetical protein EPUS_03992 [Endocarpon pusillum Z07020]
MPFQIQWKDVYVCLGCSLKASKRSISSSTKYSNSIPASQQTADTPLFVDQLSRYTPASHPSAQTDDFSQNGNISQSVDSPKKKQGNANQSPKLKGIKTRRVHPRPRLLDGQLEGIAALSRLTKKLAEVSKTTVSLQDTLKQVRQGDNDAIEKKFISTLSEIYSGRSVGVLVRELVVLQKLNRDSLINARIEHLVAELTRAGLLEAPTGSQWHHVEPQKHSSTKIVGKDQASRSAAVTTPAKLKDRKVPARDLRRSPNEAKPRRREAAAKVEATGRKSRRRTNPDHLPTSKETHEFTSTIEVDAVSISPLPRTGPDVPHLCHDLSRVLFNPGIYQLQDPRSRVYNFDPYLEKIMPVSEFDFKILKEYITSSRDGTLRSLALEHGKKYVGSSSSMTSTLAQLHFLLSQWREINTKVITRGFSETLRSFTLIQRSPSSVFLRYQDGVYAMDADKEYDSANILMSLGKSMEKLLTQEPQDFERYRKTSETKVPEEERCAPEAYQYTHAGDFLMRAQLDACDPRLPGTGTFDLKTRAVASIRHNVKQHEEGFGYQIKTRFGNWESYEREYFDMMRSAFLKYSLQVRLGRMDGIFVAFHNVERIFGFQYVSLPEMDMALHGQYDTSLGDKEFKLSVELLNRILNYITERFPKRSLRLQFETRDPATRGAFMHIFAEPMDEAKIEAIQNSRKEAIDAFEQRLMNPDTSSLIQHVDDVEAVYEQPNLPSEASAVPAKTEESATQVVDPILTEQLAAVADAAAEEVHAPPHSREGGSNEAASDEQPTTTAKGPQKAEPVSKLLMLKLRIRNRVNEKIVERPTSLASSDVWSLDYSLEEETTEAVAQAQYRASKARRKAVLEDREQNSAANFYLRKLREMASQGAEWRKAQDELDAGRKRVVLYEGR